MRESTDTVHSRQYSNPASRQPSPFDKEKSALKLLEPDLRNNYHYNYYTQVKKQSETSLDQLKFDTEKWLESFTPNNFPNTFKFLDLKGFVEHNVKLRKKIGVNIANLKGVSGSLTDIEPVKPNSQGTKLPEKTVQQLQLQKLQSLLAHQRSSLTQVHHRLGTIRQQNTSKRSQISLLQQQQIAQSIHQTPLLRSKQQQIESLSVQVQWLNEKHQHLKRMAHTNDNAFQMYQKMCRQCQRLRDSNNKKSERLKKVFQKLNKATGKEENSNMFLMNLKV